MGTKANYLSEPFSLLKQIVLHGAVDLRLQQAINCLHSVVEIQRLLQLVSNSSSLLASSMSYGFGETLRL